MNCCKRHRNRKAREAATGEEICEPASYLGGGEGVTDESRRLRRHEEEAIVDVHSRSCDLQLRIVVAFHHAMDLAGHHQIPHRRCCFLSNTNLPQQSNSSLNTRKTAPFSRSSRTDARSHLWTIVAASKQTNKKTHEIPYFCKIGPNVP